MKVVFLGSIFLLFSCASTSDSLSAVDPFSYHISKQVNAKKGAVVSAHPLASKVGVEVMKKGGNAFDAAIATQLALAVVYPGAGNIGGGGFMVARLSNGDVKSLDFRETAAAAAHKDMYLDSNGNVLPGRSIRGVSAAGVPGTIAGLFEIHKYAKLPFDELITPAILLAENGFVLTNNEATSLNDLKADFASYNNAPTAFERSMPWKEGDTLLQRDLALTLKRIRNNGAKGFYEGETAEMIVTQMLAGEGIITKEDLKSYRALWRDPYRFNYKGYEVFTMNLPSSAGIILHQAFGMIADRQLENYAPLSPAAVQLMVEVERRAYADRAQYLGDPDFYQIPAKKLTSKEYLQKRMEDFVPGKAGNSRDIHAGLVQIGESEETTHISIIDGQGNAVAVTTTLNDSYGSRTVVKGAGFLLNNEMDDFSVKPGAPNLYGAIGGEANAIAPGKRMLSSMSPTIIIKNGKVFMVAGTPGGTTIPTSVFQTIVNIVDFKLTTEQAVNIPKFHHQWLPDEIFIEPNFPDSSAEKLKYMGYVVSRRGTIGRTEVIRVLDDGTFEAVADSRGEDHAEGF
jgi:gamma-glutamyltranspeptidase/glutathione hydrolase